MEIKKTQTGGADILTLIGRLDATTAPKLQEALLEAIPRSEKLELDFAGIDYVSSAGLRVLLFVEKNVRSAGKSMTLRNVSSTVMQIFEITGFSGNLTIV